jgi:hypothetical protein
MQSDSAHKITSSLIYYYEFLSKRTSKIKDSTKNAYRINRLVLDVLTPLLQKWIQTYVNNNSINIWEELMKTNDRSLNLVKKRVQNHFNETNNHPEQFDAFDISACVSIARNMLKIQSKHGWFDDYSKINL